MGIFIYYESNIDKSPITREEKFLQIWNEQYTRNKYLIFQNYKGNPAFPIILFLMKEKVYAATITNKFFNQAMTQQELLTKSPMEIPFEIAPFLVALEDNYSIAFLFYVFS